MKTGVLIHGCNLRAENWRHIVWGDPPFALGRLPQGLLTACKMDAPYVVLGSGASAKDFRHPASDRTGEFLLESEYTLEYLKTQFDNLLNFTPWVECVKEAQDPAAWKLFKESLLAKIILDRKSQNTVEELVSAGKLFAENGVTRVVLVSSPTHIVRVLRDANKVYQSDSRFQCFRYDVHAVPCMTCYEGSTPADVVVIEPPHRPDRQVLPTHRRIQRMLALQKLEPNELLHFIDDFDELLQRYEELFFNGQSQRSQQVPQPSVSSEIPPGTASSVTPINPFLGSSCPTPY